MAQVHNDTSDSVDYVMEDGQGISFGDGDTGRLRPGEVKSLVVSSTRFAISFFRPGRLDEVYLRREQVPQSSSLRFHMTNDSPALEIK